jgi:hypothetical protein
VGLAVHGEAERRLEHLVPAQPRPQAQDELWDAAGQLPSKLRAAPAQEQVDDGDVIGLAPGGVQRLVSSPADPHALALAPQQHGQGVPVGRVTVDHQDGRGVSHPPGG